MLKVTKRDGAIVEYNVAKIAAACERALAATNDERRRIYEHFNRHETVGIVTAEAIAAAPRRP